MTTLNHPSINTDFISDVAEQAQTGDKKAMEELVILIEPMLIRSLKQYVLSNEDKDEILQELRIAVVTAVPEFNREKASFPTWFAYRISGVLRKVFFNNDGGRISQNAVIDSRRINRYLSARFSETGSYELDDKAMAYIGEIILGTEVTREQVKTLLFDCSKKTIVESELDECDSLADLTGDDFVDPEVALMKKEVKRYAMSLLENDQLSKGRKRVLEFRYASMDNDTPTSALIGKWLETSRQNVDILEKAGLAILRRFVKLNGINLDDYLD